VCYTLAHTYIFSSRGSSLYIDMARERERASIVERMRSTILSRSTRQPSRPDIQVYHREGMRITVVPKALGESVSDVLQRVADMHTTK